MENNVTCYLLNFGMCSLLFFKVNYDCFQVILFCLARIITIVHMTKRIEYYRTYHKGNDISKFPISINSNNSFPSILSNALLTCLTVSSEDSPIWSDLKRRESIQFSFFCLIHFYNLQLASISYSRIFLFYHTFILA